LILSQWNIINGGSTERINLTADRIGKGSEGEIPPAAPQR